MRAKQSWLRRSSNLSQVTSIPARLRSSHGPGADPFRLSVFIFGCVTSLWVPHSFPPQRQNRVAGDPGFRGFQKGALTRLPLIHVLSAASFPEVIPKKPKVKSTEQFGYRTRRKSARSAHPQRGIATEVKTMARKQHVPPGLVVKKLFFDFTANTKAVPTLLCPNDGQTDSSLVEIIECTLNTVSSCV